MTALGSPGVGTRQRTGHSALSLMGGNSAKTTGGRSQPLLGEWRLSCAYAFGCSEPVADLSLVTTQRPALVQSSPTTCISRRKKHRELRAALFAAGCMHLLGVSFFIFEGRQTFSRSTFVHSVRIIEENISIIVAPPTNSR